MSYQQLKKPKFYIDMMSFFHAVGHTDYFKSVSGQLGTGPDGFTHTLKGVTEDLLYLNPINLLTHNMLNTNDLFVKYSHNDWSAGGTAHLFPKFDIDFYALLNHNFGKIQINVGYKDFYGASIYFGSDLNFDYDMSINNNYDVPFDFNGFSLGKLENRLMVDHIGEFFIEMKMEGVDVNTNILQRYLGSFMLGHIWSPPHNPHLKATIRRKFDGIKSKKTQAGYTRSDISYIGSELWAGRNPFEQWNYEDGFEPDILNMIIEDEKANSGQRGRRSWKLTWDNINDTDMFGELEQSNNILNIVDTNINNPFLENDTFISKVWTPTLGGSLPFMFQIDDSNMNPDQFVIARFKKHSLKLTSKAPNLYSFSVDIEEIY